MPTSPVRPYHGKSAEERIDARRRLLLDTAFVLMAEDGWRQASIEKLCRCAKLNKRYFYESFADLDEVAAAVVDELAAGFMETGLTVAHSALAAGLPTEELAHQAIHALVTYITDDPRRARVLFTEIADSPRAVAHRRESILGLARALTAYARQHHQARGRDPIAELTSALLLGGSIEAILTWLDGKIEMSRAQLIADLAALWVFAGDGAAALAKARQPVRAEAEG